MSESDPAPFIVANPGSGTTLLRMMLDAHPDLAIPPETHFVPDLIERAREIRRANDRKPTGAELAAEIAGEPPLGRLPPLQAELRGADVGPARRVPAPRRRSAPSTSSTPRRRASRAGATRPPTTCARSAGSGGRCPRRGSSTWFATAATSRSRGGAGASGPAPRSGPSRPGRASGSRWIATARKQAADVEHYIEVRYEDLVTDTEPTLRRVCEFIELDFRAEMLDYHERASERLEELDRSLPAEEGKGERRGRAPPGQARAHRGAAAGGEGAGLAHAR